MNIIDIIIPFTVALFIIAVGVVLLYQNFQRNLIELDLEKAELKSAQQDELLRNSIMVQEEERKRIAGDLHDEIGAIISIIKMNLMLMRQKHEHAATETTSVKNIENLISLSDTAISSVRDISHQLMPPQLEAFGLLKTIESVVDKINQSGEIEVCFTVKCEWPLIKWPMVLGIYRIIMELFNNTIKHAHAKHVFLELDCLGETLIINFEDDGKGFSGTEETYRGLGIISMEARAKAMDGLFEYCKRAEKGIKATVKIPANSNIKT